MQLTSTSSQMRAPRSGSSRLAVAVVIAQWDGHLCRHAHGGCKLTTFDVPVTDQAVDYEHGRFGRPQAKQLDTTVDDHALGLADVRLIAATAAVADNKR